VVSRIRGNEMNMKSCAPGLQMVASKLANKTKSISLKGKKGKLFGGVK
jgi:hypothetical protein